MLSLKPFSCNETPDVKSHILSVWSTKYVGSARKKGLVGKAEAKHILLYKNVLSRASSCKLRSFLVTTIHRKHVVYQVKQRPNPYYPLCIIDVINNVQCNHGNVPSYKSYNVMIHHTIHIIFHHIIHKHILSSDSLDRW